MDRVKDLSKLIIQDDMVLLKAVPKSRTIILYTEKDVPEIDYSIVFLKGKKVENVEVGDIVVMLHTVHVEAYDYRNQGAYALVPASGIKMAVKPENFDENYVSINLKDN